MAKESPVLKIGMAIPSKDIDFLDSTSFIRWSGFNDIRETVWQSQVAAVKKSLKDQGNKKPTKDEIKIEKRKMFKGKYPESKLNTLAETWDEADLYRDKDGYVTFPATGNIKKGRGVPTKIKVLATFFYRIVARTPYDENYFYAYKGRPIHRIGNAYKYSLRPNGLVKKELLGKYKYTTYKMYHTADDSDSVKKDWRLRIVSFPDKKVVYFNVRDLMKDGFLFESISDTKEIKQLAEKIYAQVTDFEEATPVNTNPRVAQLEYGKYKKKNTEDNSIQAFRGPKRLHGTVGGYSVQAPRGFIRLTETELDYMEVLARDNKVESVYDLPQNTVFHDAGFSIGFDLEAYLKNKGFDLTYLFDEKSIIEATRRGAKVDADINVPHRKISELERFITKGFERCIISAKGNIQGSAKGKKPKKAESKFSIDTPGIKFTKKFESHMEKASGTPSYTLNGWVKIGGTERSAYIRILASGKPELLIDMSKSGFDGQYENAFSKEAVQELGVEFINELLRTFKED